MFSYRWSHWNSNFTLYTTLISFQTLSMPKRHSTLYPPGAGATPTGPGQNRTHVQVGNSISYICTQQHKLQSGHSGLSLRNTQTISPHIKSTETLIPVGGHTHTHRHVEVPIHTKSDSFHSPTPSASAVSLSTAPTPGPAATPATIQSTKQTKLSCSNPA